jgi:hypothetical protein
MFDEDQRAKTIKTHVQKEIGLHSIVNTMGGLIYVFKLGFNKCGLPITIIELGEV